MTRRAGAPPVRSPSKGGEDYGEAAFPGAKTRNAASKSALDAPSSNGRMLALTGREIRVRIPAGDQDRTSGTDPVPAAPVPDQKPRIGP